MLPLRSFLASLVFLAIHGLSAVAADIDSAQYFTVRTGDEWAMDAVISLPNGKELNATARRKMEDAVEKDGKSYIRARTWMEGLPSRSESTRLFRQEAHGAYSLGEKNKDAKEQVEMMFPIKAGNTWKNDDSGKITTVTTVGIENLTIGGKSYENCVHVRIVSADGTTEDNWEAPKIGTVKSETVIPNGPKILLTLKEFQPGK